MSTPDLRRRLKAYWAETMQKKFQKEASNGVRYRGLMLIPQVGNVPFPLSPNAQPSYVN